MKTLAAAVWQCVRRLWPMWALLLLALAGIAVNVHDEANRPCRPAVPVTVFVPAGPYECPEEDSCRPERHNGKWILIPQGEGGDDW